MRLVDMRRLGVRSITAFCPCRHEGFGIGVDHLPPETPVPDVGLVLRLRCRACGGRDVQTRANSVEMQAAGTSGIAAPPPAGRRAVRDGEG